MKPTITKKAAESYSNQGCLILDYVMKIKWTKNGIEPFNMPAGETLLIKSFYVLDTDFPTVREKIFNTVIAGRVFENQIAFSDFIYVPEKKIHEYILKEGIPIGSLVNYTYRLPKDDAPTKDFLLFIRGILTRML